MSLNKQLKKVPGGGEMSGNKVKPSSNKPEEREEDLLPMTRLI
jgi:hypothetical protein